MWGLATLLAACQHGEEPLLQVQFCLTPDGNGDELKQTLREIAVHKGLQYFDWSEQTESLLKSQGELAPEVKQSLPIINVGVRRADGMGVGGGNSGLPANQVSLGFTVGSDKGEAQAFAREVVARLEQQWDLVRVPQNRGAFPLNCPR